MNRIQRSELHKAISKLEQANEMISYAYEDEREKRENAPENLYDSENYVKMEETADELEDIESEINDLIDRLNEVIES